jgi:hypothetical protein
MLKQYFVNPRLDISTGNWTHDWIVWSNEPGLSCKGDDTAKKAEAQQAAFNQQLMGIFTQQYAKQSAVLDYLKNKLQPMIDKPTGYSDEALTAMRTSATDTISQAYQNAQKALQNKEFQQGGRELPSGVNAQLDEALMQAQATDKAGAQNTITANNENLKQSNLWNAMNVLSGNVASQFNPLGYANSATSGSNAVANLSQAVTASSQSGLMSTLGGIAGAGLGAAGQAGGFGKLFCWVATKAFNTAWCDPRVQAVRNYLQKDFGQTFYGRPLVTLYAKYGRWIAEQPLLVAALRPAFYMALERA